MRLSFIAAMDRAALIGGDRGMPWHLPADLRRFRELTMGKPVIVGRKTIELIGKSLPGRHNIVLTHQRNYSGPGDVIVHSIAEAMEAASDYLAVSGGDETMVIGGGVVFEEMIGLCDYAYMTMVDSLFEGTTHFPIEVFVPGYWYQQSDSNYVPPDERNPYGHWYVEAERLRVAHKIKLRFDIVDWMSKPKVTALGTM
jgi:dihydrofolate reductase